MGLVIATLTLALAAVNGYQAVTGKRVTSKPSRRTDEQMRRQSAIAAVVLGVLGLLELAAFLS